jgi:hypothetical protein
MISATRKPCRYIRKSRLAPPEPALLHGLPKALDFTRLAPHLAETARACVSWERRTYDMDIQRVVYFLAEPTCAQPLTSTCGRKFLGRCTPLRRAWLAEEPPAKLAGQPAVRSTRTQY